MRMLLTGVTANGAFSAVTIGETESKEGWEVALMVTSGTVASSAVQSTLQRVGQSQRD
jgi:hypothetical protein